MASDKINNKDINVGQALPWAVSDESGLLLLQKGSIISSEHQLQALLSLGLYMHDTDPKKSAKAAEVDNDHASPFDKFHDLIGGVTKLFTAIILKQQNVQENVYKICNDIQEISSRYSDAALGSIHLYQMTPYSICHSLHVAILSAIIAERYGSNSSQIQSIIAAALTSNVSMLELQEILHHQQAPLTDEQRQLVQDHPIRSIDMLKESGVDDENWLRAISQHHERPDGKGYPLGLIKDDTKVESQIINLADRYAAMVSGRSYRNPMTSKEVLWVFFLSKDKELNETLVLSFVKELSIFPPGSFVLLNNGETAVVIKRGRGKMWPIVSSILGPNSEPYAQPIRRNSNEEKYAIKDTCNLNNPLHIDLNMVWGF